MDAPLRLSAALLVALGVSLPPAHAAARPTAVRSVSLKTVAGGTQIDLAVDGVVANNLFTLPAPDRVVLDLSTAAFDARRVALPTAVGLVRRVRSGPRDGGGWRFVFEVDPRTEAHRVEAGAGHLRIQLSPVSESAGESATRTPAVTAPAAATVGSSVAPAESSPSTERVASASVAASETPPSAKAVSVKSTVPVAAGRGRVLTIAVDAGHGGDDPGASGPDGTHEKDVTLAIARELAGRINAEPGMRAVLTRPDDRFVPLRERINRARRAQADLFVSVHADAVPDHSVSGASVYVLSARGATNEAAKWLADRENAADLVGGVSLDDKDNVLASVLLDLSQSAAMSASMVAAEKVLSELNTVGEIRKTKVQQAGFVVLKSPDIPSMLIETAYITNPGEEKRLRDERYQQKLAGAILAGIRNYFHESPLPGTRLASLHAENEPDVRTR